MSTAAAQDVGDVVVVVLDRGDARFFEAGADGARELGRLRLPAVRTTRFHGDRQGGPGWGERDYHTRLREEERRHVEAVVERLLELDRWHGFEGVVLAGPGPGMAALARALPAGLSLRLLATTHLQEVSPATVARVAADARAARRLVLERELVAAVEAGLGRGCSTNGTRETLRALARGQVRTLVVTAGSVGPGFRCGETGRLVLTHAECRGEGEPVPVPDLAARAVEDAHRLGATTELIHDPDLAARVEGLAALLRYPS